MKPFSAQSGEAVDSTSVHAELENERRRRAVLQAQLDRRYVNIAGEQAGDYLVYATDRTGNVTYVSPSVERLFGYPADQLIGRNWRDLAYKGSRSYSIAEVEEHELLTGAESPARLITMRRADGSPVVLEVMARPLCDEDGQVIGIEGVCRETRSLDPDEVELRLTRDELEAEVLLRTAELEYRLKFEALLVSLSTGFINLPFDQIDDRLHDALQRIGEFTQVNRCFIYQLGPGGQTASLTHEWCSSGTPQIKATMQAVPLESFGWEIQQLAAGNALIFADTDQLPPQAKGIGPFYKQLGIRSALNVPLLASGEFRGMLGLSTMSGPRVWQEDSVSLVKVLGQVLVHALERHRARNALVRSEARLREVVRDQTEMIVRWTPDGRRTFVNDAVCRFHERTAEEMLNGRVDMPIHPDDLPLVQKKIASLSVDRPVEVDEHRIIKPDGSTAWYQWVDRAFFDESGRVVEYQSVGRDITPLKLTQQQLEHRLRFEQLVLDLSTKMINPPSDTRDDKLRDALRQLTEFTRVDRSYVYLLDRDRRTAKLVHHWSAPGVPPVDNAGHELDAREFAWAKRWLNSREPVYVPTLDALPPEAADWRETLRAIGVKSFIGVPMHADGQILGFMGLASFKREQHWTQDEIALLRLVGDILVNTIQRGWAEEALEENKERLKLTIEGVEEGLYDWNIQGGAVFVSDYWLRCLGLAPGENLRSQEDWRRRIHPDDWAAAVSKLRRHLVGKTPVFEAEYRMRHADGQYRWNLNRGRVIQRSPAGAPLRMVGVDRDITQAIQERERREVLQAQIAHLGRVTTMGETVAGIAHEVNQPLHAAATFNAASRNALRSGDLKKAENLSQKASDQVARAGDIIRHLREFTKPHPTELVDVELVQLLRQTAEFVMSYNRGSGAGVSFDFQSKSLTVQGDPIQYQQVFVNLVQNSVDSIVHAGVEQGRVVISSREEDGFAVIDVCDNGGGAELADLEEMFDAFYSTKAEGMGIGLSLCRTILESRGARITARNNEQAGMTFSIRIPLS